MSAPHPLLIGRGPWAQNIMRSLDELKVDYTLCGKETALDCVHRARERGNTHVVIATPLSTHYNLLIEVLHDSDEKTPTLPIFVEKPLALSVHEVEVLKERWLRNGHPKFLVDSVHLFAAGLEEMRKLRDSAPQAATAVFGGPGPTREDCHYVWDYGWHPLSLACAAGLNLNPPNWVLQESQGGYKLVSRDGVSVFYLFNQRKEKARGIAFNFGEYFFCLQPDGWEAGDREGPDSSWLFSVQPPLKRALQLFLDDTHDWKNDYRFGFDLPLAITRVLEGLCPSTGPTEHGPHYSINGSTSLAQK